MATTRDSLRELGKIFTSSARKPREVAIGFGTIYSITNTGRVVSKRNVAADEWISVHRFALGIDNSVYARGWHTFGEEFIPIR